MRIMIHPMFGNSHRPNYPNLLMLAGSSDGDVINRVAVVGVFSKGGVVVPDAKITTSSSEGGRVYFIRIVDPNGWLTCQIDRHSGEVLINTENTIGDGRVHIELDIACGSPL